MSPLTRLYVKFQNCLQKAKKSHNKNKSSHKKSKKSMSLHCFNFPVLLCKHSSRLTYGYCSDKTSYDWVNSLTKVKIFLTVTLWNDHNDCKKCPCNPHQPPMYEVLSFRTFSEIILVILWICIEKGTIKSDLKPAVSVMSYERWWAIGSSID